MSRSSMIALAALSLACSRTDTKRERAAEPSSSGSVSDSIAADTINAADRDSAGDTLRIARIEAHLIYEDGQRSDDILGPHPWTLWNTIIGEGDAKKPSHATNVRVVVTGPPNHALSGGTVQLVISGLKEVSGDTTMEAPLSPFDSTGTQTLSFDIEGTGCLPLRLTARLVAGGAHARRAALIDFDCGE